MTTRRKPATPKPVTHSPPRGRKGALVPGGKPTVIYVRATPDDEARAKDFARVLGLEGGQADTVRWMLRHADPSCKCWRRAH